MLRLAATTVCKGVLATAASVTAQSARARCQVLTRALPSKAGPQPGYATASYMAHSVAGLAGLVVGVFGASCVASATEVLDGLHPPHYPWPHDGPLDAFDHAAIRRGHQVYMQVCSACHSLQHLYWRQLVNVAYTEDEAKELAAQTEVEDGPDDEGEMFTRPGRLSDKLPEPYKNEQAARYANGGSYPPDLSLIVGARHSGTDYLFALLTGYRQPPAGIQARDGLYYNPYFSGGLIAMPQMLVDGGIEYDDGTPASSSQQAKDVTTFLNWVCYPFLDDMRQMGIKAVFTVILMIGFAACSKRLRWAPLKSQRFVFDVVK